MLQAEIGSAKVTAGESLPTRGHLMPDFTLPSSDGKPWRLSCALGLSGSKAKCRARSRGDKGSASGSRSAKGR